MRICHFSKFVTLGANRSSSDVWHPIAPEPRDARFAPPRSPRPCINSLSPEGSIYLCETVSTNAMRSIEIVSCESYSHILFHLSTLSLPFRSTTTASFPFKNYPLSSKCNNNNNNSKKKKKSDKRIKDTREKPGLGMERNDIILLTNIRDKWNRNRYESRARDAHVTFGEENFFRRKFFLFSPCVIGPRDRETGSRLFTYTSRVVSRVSSRELYGTLEITNFNYEPLHSLWQ